MTKIENKSSLSNTTFHKRCSGKQGYWWLRGESGFVELGDMYRGDRDISVDLDLPPGKYTLGCGPQGKHGIRETIVVEAETAEPKATISDNLLASAEANDCYVTVYIPTPESVAKADDWDAAADAWVAENLDTRGLRVCNAPMGVSIDVDAQGRPCKMNKGVKVVRAILVDLVKPRESHKFNGCNNRPYAKEMAIMS